jgi:dihydroorotase
MNILIKQARIISGRNPNNNKVMDILIEGGKITEIKKSIAARGNVKVIEEDGLCVSAGWLDMQAVSCDPGFEHKENLDSLLDCAAAGGFTGVCIHNYCQPALHTKSQIEYLVNKSRNKIVDVYPVGTITVEGKGKELAEMYDMKQSGAVAFSDYKNAIKDSGMLMRALQYAGNVDSFIITHCNDESISHGGQMNEGETAVTVGLKGIPALAEEIMLQRNLSLLEYTGGKLHIPTISTKGSVDLIKKAKAGGLNVTAGVASINLVADDTSLKDFNTNFKLDPPLRSKKDVQALRNGIENGIISVIVSDHAPQDVESKELEFDLAENGALNLQTAFSCALEALKEDNIEAIVNCFTAGPRTILNMEVPSIAEGTEANLTLFSLNGETVLTEKTNNSRSKNSPFLNRPLKGKVIGIINGAKSYFN